jgi:hypothetical protein
MKMFAKKLNAKLIQSSDAINISFKSPFIYVDQNDKLTGTLTSQLSIDSGNFYIPLDKKNQKSMKLTANAKVTQLNHNIELPEIYDISKMISLFKYQISNSRQNQNKVVSKGIDLNIKVKDNLSDSIWAKSNLYQFPLALNFQISGKHNAPIFSGDIRSKSGGNVIYAGLSVPIDQLELNWKDKPISQGNINLRAEKPMRLCTSNESRVFASNNSALDSCQINMELTGALTNPKFIHDAKCRQNIEFSASLLARSLLLDCVPTEENQVNSNTFINKGLQLGVGQVGKFGDQVWQRLFGRKLFGGNISVNIGNQENIGDSTSYRIPFQITDNLAFIIGQTWAGSGLGLNNSLDYDKLTEATLKYNIWDNTQVVTQNKYPGKLSIQSSLITKTLKPSATTAIPETDRVEKNIGIQHEFQFWKFCLFGFGDCHE